MATSVRANTRNFVRWFKTTDLTEADYLADGVPGLIDNVNGGTVYTPNDLWSERNTLAAFMVAGATFTSYANIDTLETDTNFANWSLKLVQIIPGGRYVEVDLGNVFTQYLVVGSQYRFSLTFTVPELEGSCYELAIIDDSDNVLYVSEDIGFTVRKRGIEQIRYRSSEDVFNYDYTLTEDTFYNQYYVSTWIKAAGDPTVRAGYVLSDGSFKNIRSTSGRNYEFITQAYEILDHEAFKIATLHGLFNMVFEGNWTKFSLPEGSSYEYEFADPRDKLADGGVVLEQDDTFSSNTSFDEPVLPDGGMIDTDEIFMSDLDGVIMSDTV